MDSFDESDRKSSGGAEGDIDVKVGPFQLDSYTSSIQVHQPPAPKARPVVMLHGIQSHPGWFTASADALAAAGHPVVQFTRRGSGTNTAGRGDAPSIGRLMADLQRVIEHTCERFAARRVHLVGISWGGKYAACYALDRPRAERLARLILVAPGIAAKVTVPPLTRAAVAICSLIAPRVRFRIPLSDPALFTDNPERRRFIRDDPDALHKATARFLAISRRLDWKLALARNGSIAAPVTLLLGRRDRIIDSDRARAVVARLAGGEQQTLEFDAAHTLQFEPDPAEYLTALVGAAAD